MNTSIHGVHDPWAVLLLLLGGVYALGTVSLMLKEQVCVR